MTSHSLCWLAHDKQRKATNNGDRDDNGTVMTSHSLCRLTHDKTAKQPTMITVMATAMTEEHLFDNRDL